MSPLSFSLICHLIWQLIAILVSLFHSRSRWCLLCFHEKFLTYSWNSLAPLTMECVSIKQKKSNLLNCQRTSFRTVKKEVLLKICKKRRNRQTWQSYQIWQKKILSLSDKNSLSKLNLKPQFIIRGWSEAGGFYTKNCQISEPNSADLCNMIFNVT